MTTSNPVQVSEELREIQGGLIGFNKDHERLIFVNFGDPSAAKQFVAELEPQLANGYEVTRFNEAFRENRRHNGDPNALQATWVNLWLSRSGLALLGASGLDAFPPEFAAGMG